MTAPAARSVKQKCRTCDGHGDVLIGDTCHPCPDCNPSGFSDWERAQDEHAERCAGAHGLPPGAPC